MNSGINARLFCHALLFAFIPAFIIATPTVAQDGAGAPEHFEVYAAKFTCGKTPDDDDVVRGVFATSINIHNPLPVEVLFEKRVIIANREGDRPGQISASKNDALAPGGAMRIDCRVITSLLTNPPPHIEGFVEITIDLDRQKFGGIGIEVVGNRLDVVGKYTARPFTGEVSSLEVVVYNAVQLTVSPLNP